MAVTNFTPLLGLALPTTGDLSGTWGTTVNTAITDLLDDAVAGTVTLSANADVTLTTTNGADNQARNAVILWTASNGATTRNITAPAQSKAYVVINAGTGSIVVRGSGPTAGVTIPSGARALVAWNGSDFVKIVSNPVVLTTDVSGILPVANGGTATATPALVQGTGVTITGTWPNQTINATGTGGTVTAVSVASANGFAGTSSGGATPALTLSTSITGVLKGNATAISAATAGTDYVAPGTATTFTATQTFAGTSSNLAEILTNAAEVATVSATAATGTINYDVTTQSVQYYTSNASANWTVNFRASSGTSLNTAMTTGQSVTVAFLVTQGSTAYYNNVVQVDGSTVTPKYQGGTAYAAGNASAVDVYMYTIIKTGNAAFTVFTSQTKFA